MNMINVLTKGTVNRLLVGLCWLIAALVYFFKNSHAGMEPFVGLMLVLSALLLQVNVSKRLKSLLLAKSSAVIPNFYFHLKLSLVALLMIGYLPLLAVFSPEGWYPVLVLVVLLSTWVATSVIKPKLTLLLFMLLVMIIQVAEQNIVITGIGKNSEELFELLMRLYIYMLIAIMVLGIVFIERIAIKDERQTFLSVLKRSNKLDGSEVNKNNLYWPSLITRLQHFGIRKKLLTHRSISKQSLIKIACSNMYLPSDLGLLLWPMIAIVVALFATEFYLPLWLFGSVMLALTFFYFVYLYSGLLTKAKYLIRLTLTPKFSSQAHLAKYVFNWLAITWLKINIAFGLALYIFYVVNTVDLQLSYRFFETCIILLLLYVATLSILLIGLSLRQSIWLISFAAGVMFIYGVVLLAYLNITSPESFASILEFSVISIGLFIIAAFLWKRQPLGWKNAMASCSQSYGGNNAT